MSAKKKDQHRSSANADDVSPSTEETTLSHTTNRKEQPLYLLCLDINNLPPFLRTIILIGGLVLFMCLYGYFQELVVYSWFNKKLSVFVTFLHFMGCTVFAIVQVSPSSSLFVLLLTD
jgi:hypothetical protein